jgi:hypothetical protein
MSEHFSENYGVDGCGWFTSKRTRRSSQQSRSRMVPDIGVPLHPSIEKKDRAQISAEEQWSLDRFKDAVALELALDGPAGAQYDE